MTRHLARAIRFLGKCRDMSSTRPGPRSRQMSKGMSRHPRTGQLRPRPVNVLLHIVLLCNVLPLIDRGIEASTSGPTYDHCDVHVERRGHHHSTRGRPRGPRFSSPSHESARAHAHLRSPSHHDTITLITREINFFWNQRNGTQGSLLRGLLRAKETAGKRQVIVAQEGGCGAKCKTRVQHRRRGGRSK